MIFRLACLQIQSHRLRTLFAAVAAVLTSILYMTVISISYCILDSTRLSRMLAAGSDFHASVTDRCRRYNCGAFLSDADQNTTDPTDKT